MVHRGIISIRFSAINDKYETFKVDTYAFRNNSNIWKHLSYSRLLVYSFSKAIYGATECNLIIHCLPWHDARKQCIIHNHYPQI